MSLYQQGSHGPAESQTRSFRQRGTPQCRAAVVKQGTTFVLRLLEEPPSGGADGWGVLRDGRMETISGLPPNLPWHDGAALTADDVAFAWRVFADPALANIFTAAPQNLMEGAVALDDRTVLIRW